MQSDDGWNTRPGRVVVRIRQRAGTCWIRTSRGIGEDDVRRGKEHENPMTYRHIHTLPSLMAVRGST